MTFLMCPRGRLQTLGVLAAATLAWGLAGCGNTLSGAKQDTAADSQKVSTAADQAAATTAAEAHKVGASTAAAAHKVGAAVEAVPEDAEGATVVTPEVKTAIIRDPVLNDPRNVVNVSSASHVTHLTGHVMNASMKQRATEDAQAVLAKHHANYTLANGLVVSGPAQ